MQETRITINGFGRIGRAVLRRARSDERFKIVAINDLNPDPNNICYMYNYDSIQGVSAGQAGLTVTDINGLQWGGSGDVMRYSQLQNCAELDCAQTDILIDATGLSTNGGALQALLAKYPHLKVIATHCHPDAACHLVLGGNHDKVDLSAMRFISSSICDATALAPVLRALDESFGVVLGHITTAHPWLSYQNLLDGPSTSWANPGQIYHHYPLGRSALDNLIPKPTTAVTSTLKSLDDFNAKLTSFSYRVPTSIVGSADVILQLEKPATSKEEVVKVLKQFSDASPWPLFAINEDPLISKDFINRPESAVIDARWLDIADAQLHLVLWYDNENGYALRVLDQACLLHTEY